MERPALFDPRVVRMIASSVPLDALVCSDADLARDALPLFAEVHMLDPGGIIRDSPGRKRLLDAGVNLRGGMPYEELEAIAAEMAGRRVAYMLGRGVAPNNVRALEPGDVLVATVPAATALELGLRPPEGGAVIDLGADGFAVGPELLAPLLAPVLERAEVLAAAPSANGGGPAGDGGGAEAEESEEERLRRLLGERDTLIVQQRERIEQLEQRLGELYDQVRRGASNNPVIHRLQKLKARARPITGTRLGLLWHHRPKPLEIPDSYRQVRPPQPAPSMTVVVPSFNQAEFVGRTLDSLLEQGYPELEVIVQDGASTDGTGEVLAGYADRVTRITSEPDGGQADAINRGFEGSTGEIMGWLNSDDLLLPGTLAYVAAHFAAHPEVDVVYGHRVLIDSEDREIGRWAIPAHDDAIISWADFIPQETMFWRRGIWERSGARVDPSFRFALDWDLLLRFREAGARFERLPRYLGAFRVHETQKSSAQVTTIGRGEMDRLRRRVHGRRVTPRETAAAVKPYLRKHRRLDKLQRLGIVRH